MKKLIGLCVLMMLPLLASAAKYTEGNQYTKVSEVASKKPEVREYFSFYCGHCMAFSPFIEKIKVQLPEHVLFEYNHVDFLRAASPEIQKMLSKAVIVAEKMNMQKKLMGALFNYIQVQKATISSEKDIRNIFVLNGADGETFDKLMKSFNVNSKANQLKKNQDALSKTRGLTGVPAVVVNGKYRINNGKLDSKNIEADFKALVDYLLTLD